MKGIWEGIIKSSASDSYMDAKVLKMQHLVRKAILEINLVKVP